MPAFGAILFSTGLLSPSERVQAAVLAGGSAMAAIRLARCRICRTGNEYRVVNFLRTHRVALSNVRDLAFPGLISNPRLPWARLSLIDGRTLRVTALPGHATDRHVAAFLADFEIHRRPAAAPTTRDAPKIFPAEETGRRPRSMAARALFIAWALGFPIAIIALPEHRVAIAFAYSLGLFAWAVTSRLRRS